MTQRGVTRGAIREGDGMSPSGVRSPSSRPADTFTECHFSGGPASWRKDWKGRTLAIRDDVSEVMVPGPSRPIKRAFRSAREFERELRKGPLTWRTGVYHRA